MWQFSEPFVFHCLSQLRPCFPIFITIYGCSRLYKVYEENPLEIPKYGHMTSKCGILLEFDGYWRISVLPLFWSIFSGVLLITWPAVLLVLPLAKLNFDILVLWKDPYCILLLSVMSVDEAQKKDDEIWLYGSWDLGILFQKVLPAGHSTGQVIIIVYLGPITSTIFSKCSGPCCTAGETQIMSEVENPSCTNFVVLQFIMHDEVQTHLETKNYFQAHYCCLTMIFEQYCFDRFDEFICHCRCHPSHALSMKLLRPILKFLHRLHTDCTLVTFKPFTKASYRWILTGNIFCV